MWIIVAIFSIGENKHLMLHCNNLNVTIIANNILDLSTSFFDSELFAKILLKCLLVSLALMILGVLRNFL